MKINAKVEYPDYIRALPNQPFYMSLNIRLSDKYNYSYLIYEPCVAYVFVEFEREICEDEEFLID